MRHPGKLVTGLLTATALLSPADGANGGTSGEEAGPSSGERRLTDWPGSESYPRFSPDGEWVAFTAAPQGQSDIYLLRIADGATRRLTGSPAADQYPAWSPDGSTIAYSTRRDGVAGIWAMPVAGGDSRPIFVRPGMSAIAPDYGPDGRLVVTVIEPNPDYGSYGYATPWVMNTDGGEPRPLSSGGDEWFGRWMPDGRRVVYYGGALDPIDTVDADSGEIGSISAGRHVGWRPAPSADGTTLAFVSSPNATAWLRTLGGDPLFVALTSRGVDDFPTISPDGSHVVLAADRSEGSIIAQDLETGARTVVAQGVLPQPMAGGRVAFLTEDKPPTLMFLDARTASFRPWPIRLPGILGFSVSAAGDRVLAATSVGPAQGAVRLYSATVAGDDATLHDLIGESPTWCGTDGPALVNRREGVYRQIFAVDPDAGTERQLTFDDGSKRITACSTDGRFMSYRYTSGRSGTAVIERTGEGWIKRYEVDGPEGAVSPEGTRLAFVSNVDGHTDVFIRQPDGSTTRVTNDALAESHVSWSPDGGQLFFTARDAGADLWLVPVPPRDQWRPLESIGERLRR